MTAPVPLLLRLGRGGRGVVVPMTSTDPERRCALASSRVRSGPDRGPGGDDLVGQPVLRVVARVLTVENTLVDVGRANDPERAQIVVVGPGIDLDQLDRGVVGEAANVRSAGDVGPFRSCRRRCRRIARFRRR